MRKHEGFTPGPWVADQCDVVPQSSPDFLRPLAQAKGTFPEAFANAALIADAPRLYAENAELVEALRELVERCDGVEGVRGDGSNIQTMRAHALLARIEAE